VIPYIGTSEIISTNCIPPAGSKLRVITTVRTATKILAPKATILLQKLLQNRAINSPDKNGINIIQVNILLIK
jgi:hypothetical protein